MPPGPVRGRRWADHRRTLEAVVWTYRTCSPWRDPSEELGPFQSAHTDGPDPRRDHDPLGRDRRYGPPAGPRMPGYASRSSPLGVAPLRSGTRAVGGDRCVECVVDLHEAVAAVADRRPAWQAAGLVAEPVTWRDGAAPWPRQGKTERSQVHGPDSVGIHLHGLNEVELLVVLHRGGWADIDCFVDAGDAGVVPAPSVVSAQAFACLLDACITGVFGISYDVEQRADVKRGLRSACMEAGMPSRPQIAVELLRAYSAKSRQKPTVARGFRFSWCSCPSSNSWLMYSARSSP